MSLGFYKMHILRLSQFRRTLWYHMIQNQIWCFSELVLSCQKHNLT